MNQQDQASSTQVTSATSVSSRQAAKRSRANNSAVRSKRLRMQLTDTHDFTEIDSALDRGAVWFYRKNVENFASYRDFLRAVKPELVVRLAEIVGNRPIKYNLKLEASYHIPRSEAPPEDRAFKTRARALLSDTDIGCAVDEDFEVMLAEEDVYSGRGSGFTLSHIDGIMLSVYKYTPLAGSSYIPIPSEINNRKAIINPQNIDQSCFKWSILSRHVKGDHKYRVDRKYFNEEHRYNFTGLTFLTPVSQIKIFERQNPNVSVNVYGLERDDVKMKWLVYPLRVADQEQQNHFDLLYIGDSVKSHYAYISDFSKLVRKQKTRHQGRIYTCKRCFTCFDDRPKKHILRGQQALEQHKLICGKNKPILPVMPAEGSKVEFEAWVKTQRLPFVIYADFEALLEKTDDRMGAYTRTVHTHHPMSYGFMVKTSDDVPSTIP
ncbi:uncharacterized protein LOC126909241 [Daktulosphaira vitifoliae]|uniref:uncharacterized protein LOC126909241 n=1 Tax=Daktulosphaira vitifoliae TaxID=58002 RepID=UPI0021AAA5FA|nr:uncharacterized protein LOC126909241 [Daktulosphaira vitifoliae]